MKVRALHPAERKYMQAAAQGLTVAETARQHGVAVSTVNTSLKHAKAALGARTISHAVALCLATGELDQRAIRSSSTHMGV